MLTWWLLTTAITLSWSALADRSGPWRELSYRGHTAYTIQRDSTATDSATSCLHAEARGTYSALVHVVPKGAGLTELSWRWRVLCHPDGADPSSRKRDDRAAGVFVLVHRSVLPWRTRGILYQWSPAGAPGVWTSSPYASEIKVLTLQTAPAGPAWRTEQRDIRADLLAAFGVVPSSIEAIGVVCDADNTGGTAISEFGELLCRFQELPKRDR